MMLPDRRKLVLTRVWIFFNSIFSPAGAGMRMKKVVLLQGGDECVEKALDEFCSALNAFDLVAGRTRPRMPSCIVCGRIRVSVVAVVMILLPLAVEKMIRRVVRNSKFLRDRG